MDNSVIKTHKPTTQSNDPIVLPYLLQTFIKVIKHHRCNRSPLGALPLSSPIPPSLRLTARFRVYHLNPYFTKYVFIQTLYLILFLNTIYIHICISDFVWYFINLDKYLKTGKFHTESFLGFSWNNVKFWQYWTGFLAWQCGVLSQHLWHDVVPLLSHCEDICACTWTAPLI